MTITNLNNDNPLGISNTARMEAVLSTKFYSELHINQIYVYITKLPIV